MFRKPDRDLFTRVFDEGKDGDPGMEWLRDGLKELRDVPEHGLSNERLRDRVLGTGLAPVRPTAAPWWSWAWAPVAAAAIAVVVLPRLRTAPDPQVILQPERVAIGGPAFESASDRKALDQIASGAPQVASADSFDVETALAEAARLPDLVASPRSERSDSVEMPRSTPSGNTPRIRRRVERPSPQSVVVAPRVKASAPIVATTTGEAPRYDSQAADVATFATGNESGTMARMAVVVPETSSPLVVLTPEIDAATGASSATEVDSPANLSIGG